MLQSQLFYKTLKKVPKETEIISHQLLVRADFISQLASGIYSFLPLGYRTHQKIADIIREELNLIGGQEIFLPVLQPKELWQKTNRWKNMEPPLFKIKDRHKREFVLGPTHEEVVTDLLKSRIQSYKDLPLALYQIQTKFRDELRFTGGLLRTKEFVMKDLYSFHAGQADLEKFFDKVLVTYNKIYKRCGLNALKSEASGGVFTKEKTYEFQVLTEVGEDKVIFCKNCKWTTNLEVARVKTGQRCPKCKKGKLIRSNSIEVGHTFCLGTKYSEALGLYFIDKKAAKKAVVMGCYGIGIGRLMAAIVEINHDNKGIIWPKEVAPFYVHLIQINPTGSRSMRQENSAKVKRVSEKLYQDLQKDKIEVLYDDRNDKTAGEKFAEADLIGIPNRIVISEKTIKKNCVELKKRENDKIELIKINRLLKILESRRSK